MPELRHGAHGRDPEGLAASAATGLRAGDADPHLVANREGVGDAAIAGVGCPAVPGLPRESPRVNLAMVPPSVALVTMLTTETTKPVS